MIDAPVHLQPSAHALGASERPHLRFKLVFEDGAVIV